MHLRRADGSAQSSDQMVTMKFPKTIPTTICTLFQKILVILQTIFFTTKDTKASMFVAVQSWAALCVVNVHIPSIQAAVIIATTIIILVHLVQITNQQKAIIQVANVELRMDVRANLSLQGFSDRVS